MQVVARIADTITVLQRGQVIAERNLRRGLAQPAGDGGLHGFLGRRDRERARVTDAPLRISGLHAYYGESHVLHGVECYVNRGEVVTLLGRNGAGRTTTLKALLGLVGRRSGSVLINGRETIALQTTPDCAPRGSAIARRSAASTRACRPKRTCCCRPCWPPGGLSLDEIYAMFPNLKERRSQPGHTPLRRRAADAGRWRGSCAPVRGCCCWMRFPKDWRR